MHTLADTDTESILKHLCLLAVDLSYISDLLLLIT